MRGTLVLGALAVAVYLLARVAARTIAFGWWSVPLDRAASALAVGAVLFAVLTLGRWVVVRYVK